MSSLTTSAKALGGFAGRDGAIHVDALAIAAAVVVCALAVLLIVRAHRVAPFVIVPRLPFARRRQQGTDPLPERGRRITDHAVGAEAGRF